MKNDERGTFEDPTPNGHERNAYAGTLVSPETPLHETLTHELSVVAAQLVEAACKAREGDREATERTLRTRSRSFAKNRAPARVASMRYPI